MSRIAPVIGCVLLLAATSAAAAEKAPARPNILFILADDVGEEVLGAYGGESYETSNLDKLARGGMRFEYCYSMPACHPSRVCLLTGRYPFRLGHPRWGTFPKSAEDETFAQVLKRAGYATAIAGKWQITKLQRDPEHPHRLGFDQYSLFGWHEGPRYWQPRIWQNGELREGVEDRYGPDVYTEFLIDFMENNRDKPFFAFYSMALCHAVSDDFKDPVPFGPGMDRYENFKEMAEAMDDRVGRLVEALDRLKLRERTLILFTGDNGTLRSLIVDAEDGKLIKEPVYSVQNGEKVRGGKTQLTDAGTNVPLIANWPGTISGGQVVDDLVDFSDFLPAFAELAGAKLPTGVELDGRSFASRLLGESPAPRDWASSERGGSYFVRTQRYKLYGDGKFYDMQADPQEKKPLDTGSLSGAAKDAYQELRAAKKSLGRE